MRSHRRTGDQPKGDQDKDDKGKDDKDKGDKDKKEEPKPAPESNDRLFWALPNFLTVENEGQAPPLTAGQKFHETIRSSFDYVDYGWYALLAGLSQVNHGEPGYGTGAEGYAKRYGAAFADGTIENVMTSALFPALLHEDPRYYQRGKGGAWNRTVYP